MTDRPYPPLRPQTPPRNRRRAAPLALVIGIVVLAVLALILAVILLTRDDGQTAGESPGAQSPSASASATDTPSPSAATSASPTTAASGTPTASAGPSPVVAAPDGILPAGSVVAVTAEGLRIRDEPSTSGAVLATVGTGEVLYLASNANNLGPIEAEGHAWYVVTHAPSWLGWPENPPGTEGPSGDPRVSGWVAAGSGSDSFVALVPVDCPAGTVDIRTVYAMTPWARLACFGDRPLTFEGTYGCDGCGGLAPGTFTPEWLADPINFNLLQPPYAEGHSAAESLVLREPPDGPTLEDVEPGSVLRVTGHFNDPRAAECSMSPGLPGEEVAASETAAEWLCREQFVAESWEVLGTDPDFGG